MPGWITAAEEELGVAEIPGPESEARIENYWLHVLGRRAADEVPWCAAFVNAMLERAGCEGTRSGLARSFDTWGVDLGGIADGPLGAIVTLEAPNHVGFLYGIDDRRRPILLSGNYGDRVALAPFAFDRIAAVRWPWPPLEFNLAARRT